MIRQVKMKISLSTRLLEPSLLAQGVDQESKSVMVSDLKCRMVVLRCRDRQIACL